MTEVFATRSHNSLTLSAVGTSIHQTAPYLIKTIKKWTGVALHCRLCYCADYCESGFRPSRESIQDLVAAFDTETASNRIVLFGCRILFP